jgi:hypothetical protein
MTLPDASSHALACLPLVGQPPLPGQPPASLRSTRPLRSVPPLRRPGTALVGRLTDQTPA